MNSEKEVREAWEEIIKGIIGEAIEEGVRVDKETLAKIRKKAKSLAKILETEILPQQMNPEYISLMKLIRFLEDGKEHSWKEIQENVKLSTKTISKTLKKMVSQGLVERKVRNTFPPKTTYRLKKSLFLGISWFLTSLNKYGESLLLFSLLSNEISTKRAPREIMKKLVDLLLKNFLTIVILNIKFLASCYEKTSILPTLEEESFILGFLPALSVSFSFWLTVFVFLLNDDLRRAILKLPDSPELIFTTILSSIDTKERSEE